MSPKFKKQLRKRNTSEKQREMKENNRIQQLNFLDREIKYGNVTKMKQEKKLSQLLIELKMERYEEDIKYAWPLFEWTLDLKDFAISVLMDELNEINEQNLLIIWKHNEFIVDMFHKMQKNIEKLQEDFLVTLGNIKNYYKNKNYEYLKNIKEMQYNMKNLLFEIDINRDVSHRYQMIMKHLHSSEFLTQAKNHREYFETIYKDKMIDIFKQTETIFNEHMHNIENRKYKVKSLPEIKLRQNLRKLVYLTDLIKIFEAKLLNLHETQGEHLWHLQENQEEFDTHLFILKNKLVGELKLDSERQKQLVCNAQSVLAHLGNIANKGELMIRKMVVNKRYESSLDKILSYPVYDLSIMPRKTEPDKLFLFHQKMAAVDAERIALYEEKKMLLLEQKELKKKLRELCGCLKCPNRYTKLKTKKRHTTFNNFQETSVCI